MTPCSTTSDEFDKRREEKLKEKREKLEDMRRRMSNSS
jgi:hypothetical protein